MAKLTVDPAAKALLHEFAREVGMPLGVVAKTIAKLDGDRSSLSVEEAQDAVAWFKQYTADWAHHGVSFSFEHAFSQFKVHVRERRSIAEAEAPEGREKDARAGQAWLTATAEARDLPRRELTAVYSMLLKSEAKDASDTDRAKQALETMLEALDRYPRLLRRDRRHHPVVTLRQAAKLFADLPAQVRHTAEGREKLEAFVFEGAVRQLSDLGAMHPKAERISAAFLTDLQDPRLAGTLAGRVLEELGPGNRWIDNFLDQIEPRLQRHPELIDALVETALARKPAEWLQAALHEALLEGISKESMTFLRLSAGLLTNERFKETGQHFRLAEEVRNVWAMQAPSDRESFARELEFLACQPELARGLVAGTGIFAQTELDLPFIDGPVSEKELRAFFEKFLDDPGEEFTGDITAYAAWKPFAVFSISATAKLEMQLRANSTGKPTFRIVLHGSVGAGIEIDAKKLNASLIGRLGMEVERFWRYPTAKDAAAGIVDYLYSNELTRRFVEGKPSRDYQPPMIFERTNTFANVDAAAQVSGSHAFVGVDGSLGKMLSKQKVFVTEEDGSILCYRGTRTSTLRRGKVTLGAGLTSRSGAGRLMIPASVSWLSVPFTAVGHPDREKTGKFLLQRIDIHIAPTGKFAIDLSKIPAGTPGWSPAVAAKVKAALASSKFLDLIHGQRFLDAVHKIGTSATVKIGIRIEMMDKDNRALRKGTEEVRENQYTRVYFFPVIEAKAGVNVAAAKVELSSKLQILNMIGERMGPNEDFWKLCHKRWMLRQQNPKRWKLMTNDAENLEHLVAFFERHGILTPAEAQSARSDGLDATRFRACLNALEQVWARELTVDDYRIAADASRVIQLTTTGFLGGLSEENKARAVRVLRRYMRDPQALRDLFLTMESLGCYLEDLVERMESGEQPTLRRQVEELLQIAGMSKKAGIQEEAIHPDQLFAVDVSRAKKAWERNGIDELTAIMAAYQSDPPKLLDLLSNASLPPLSDEQKADPRYYSFSNMLAIATGQYDAVIERDLAWIRERVGESRPGVPRQVDEEEEQEILEVLHKSFHSEPLMVALKKRLARDPTAKMRFEAIFCDIIAKHGEFYHIARELGIESVQAIIEETTRRREAADRRVDEALDATRVQEAAQAHRLRTIRTETPKEPTKKERSEVATQTVDRIMEWVERHKDVEGTGRESAAQGDPRITGRREAVNTLIAGEGLDGVSIEIEKLGQELGPNVQADIAWLKAADYADYSVDGDESQFSSANGDFTRPREVQAEFAARVKKGEEQAKALGDGTRTYFDVSDGSVVGLHYLEDPGARIRSIADAVWQFRARTDNVDIDVESYFNRTRIDKIGLVLVAEQRIVLAEATLDSKDAASVREYALLRQLITSHPTSSVNSIFEARNGVGVILMDGEDRYSSETHATAWIKYETPPGASTSPYSAIHHNFSRDTPNTIEKWITEWMFPMGPETERPALYVSLVNALELARGNPAALKGAFEAIDVSDAPAALEPVLEKLRELDEHELTDVVHLLAASTRSAGGDTGRARSRLAEIRPEVKRTPPQRLAIELLRESDPTLESLRSTVKEMREEIYSQDAVAKARAILERRKQEVPACMVEALETADDTTFETVVKSLLSPFCYSSDTNALREGLEENVGATAQDLVLDSLLALEPTDFAWLLPNVETLRSTFTADGAAAQKVVESLDRGAAKKTLQPLTAALADAGDEGAYFALLTFLRKTSTKPLGEHPARNLMMAARTYEAVCGNRVTADSLMAKLFLAGKAWPEVADVIARMQGGNELAQLKELGEARLAMRDAIFAAKTGYERHHLILLDGQLNRLTCEELGAAVNRVGNLTEPKQRSEAMFALQTALQSVVASGLHAIKSDDDEPAHKGTALAEILTEVQKAISSGKITEDEYRDLMTQAHVAVVRTIQNMRAFMDERAPEVVKGGIELDPEFIDQFVKQTALHYATALTQRGMRVGLKEEIGARRIANVEGLRALNTVGPVVFPSIVFATNAAHVAQLRPPPDALVILYELKQKKMVAVGGLVLDTKYAPGGNSHLNMYAMNNGIPVLALPKLRTKYVEFLENASKEGGVYMDDQNGQVQLTTVQYAIEKGLLKASDVEKLRPGVNRRITYLKSNATGTGFEVLAEHEAMISPYRPTREVELYVPLDEVKGIGSKVVSFKELATLGIHGRHLAGEKGLVLALMTANPKLEAFIPGGSMVTTGRVRAMLDGAKLAPDDIRRLKTVTGLDTSNVESLLDAWNLMYLQDPTVGRVDDTSFLQSKLYTDPDYRDRLRVFLHELTRDALTEYLLDLGPKARARIAELKKEKLRGPEKIVEYLKKADVELTAAGQTLYEEMLDNPDLKASKAWIARSSFTGEDRPGKSGAGQYESYAVLISPAQRIWGTIGVIESTWGPEPIENNVAAQINLQHIWPSVLMQDCLNPEFSGVVISRDIETGTRGKISYQLVKGFGGGVDGGKTEEGLVSKSGTEIKIYYPGMDESLISDEDKLELRALALEVEKQFHDVIEPGKGHAVDMEVCHVEGEWRLVQARVIQMDK